jgi:hypothetical protein
MDGRVGHDDPHFSCLSLAVTASDKLRAAGIVPGASGVRLISPFNHPHVMQNGALLLKSVKSASDVHRDTNRAR